MIQKKMKRLCKIDLIWLTLIKLKKKKLLITKSIKGCPYFHLFSNRKKQQTLRIPKCWKLQILIKIFVKMMMKVIRKKIKNLHLHLYEVNH